MPTPPKSTAATPYREIRAVTRAFELLEATSDLGWSKVSELAAYTGIDRGTLYRLLHTLELKGYIARRAEDGTVSLTERILQVGDGVRQDDLVINVMSQLTRELTEQVIWPSDFGTLIGGQMVIQASSHKYSPVSVHRRMVGRTRPLLRSALGLAYLSSLNQADLERTLDIARRIGASEADDLNNLTYVKGKISEVHLRGYALSSGLVEQNISAIALPVRLGRKTLGAVNIVFFRSAMSPEEAEKSCLLHLRGMVARAEVLIKARALPNTWPTAQQK